MSRLDREREHLNNLSRSMLRLHRALLDDARVSYERVHGRIPYNGAVLQLAVNDPWFAWLRPLSQLMIKLDELMESKAASTSAEIPSVIQSVRTLLTPTGEGEGFGRQYRTALQRSHDVVLEHAAVKALLRQSVPSKGRVK